MTGSNKDEARRWATFTSMGMMSQTRGEAVRMAVAYSRLTVEQLKGMLGAARADHQVRLKEIKLKWGVEVTALRKAMAQRMAQATAEIQAQKNINVALQRELDIVHAELAKANATIAEQERKLSVHVQVAELEKRLSIARRAAS